MDANRSGLRRPAPALRAGEGERHPFGGALCVLVVDDQSLQRRIAARLCETCGATQVLEAEDGGAALDLIAAHRGPIDIVISDLDMPGMDGVEFLRNVASRGLASSVIIASSLEPQLVRSVEAMARSYGVRILGAADKPLSRDKLHPLILRHLGRRGAPVRPRAEPLALDAIRAALESGAVEPYFQPKVELRTGAVAGVEALVRLRDPVRGLIPPDAFLPAMEANGLIDAATEAMLDRALAAVAGWARAGLDLTLAINVSAVSLGDITLPDRIVAEAARHGVAPRAITVEITESAAMTDVARALDTLARLRMKGMGLSIDDYGTGFSSMQQLGRIPFTEMKIDRVFVAGATEEQTLCAMLETSVALARRLHLHTVAEGVETAEDWGLLHELGCDAAQGYFIGPPVPEAELPDLVADWNARRVRLGP